MLQLDNLVRIKKKRKRVGRGGDLGGTSGRGHKGQKARTGGKHKLGPLFEGGQMPLNRRIPQRGFSNRRFKKEFVVINIEDLEKRFNVGDKVTLETLKEKGLVKGKVLVKILGSGNLTKHLIVEADAFSQSALKAIQDAGGKAILVKESRSVSTAA